MADDNRIQFYNADDNTLIAASRLKIILQNGEHFTIESRPGRGGSVVFIINNNHDNRNISLFSIEPGAINLFSVNVTRVSNTLIN